VASHRFGYRQVYASTSCVLDSLENGNCEFVVRNASIGRDPEGRHERILQQTEESVQDLRNLREHS
jgi:hypothetical protein